MARIENLKQWMERDLSRWGKLETHILELDPTHGANDELHYRVQFFTDTNAYTISAVERDGERNYLGCVSSCRKPRAGEDWHRGSDLPDGYLCEETWRDILAAIVSYEMVKVHPPAKAMADAEIKEQAA